MKKNKNKNKIIKRFINDITIVIAVYKRAHTHTES